MIAGFDAPRAWNLTRQQDLVLGVLYRSEELVTHETLRAALVENGSNAVSGKLIHVIVCGLRDKVKAHGVMIAGVHAKGYQLAPEARAILAEIAAQPKPPPYDVIRAEWRLSASEMRAVQLLMRQDWPTMAALAAAFFETDPASDAQHNLLRAFIRTARRKLVMHGIDIPFGRPGHGYERLVLKVRPEGPAL